MSAHAFCKRVRQIEEATNSIWLREILNKSIHLVPREEIHNAFLERVHFLLGETEDPAEIENLEEIRERVENCLKSRPVIRGKRRGAKTGPRWHFEQINQEAA